MTGAEALHIFPAPGSQRTALLVEDEYDTRELLARALERAGHLCRTASDCEGALCAAQEMSSLDVVVTDIVLGNESHGGLRLMSALLERGLRGPVIVITAYADVENLKIALNEGATHFLEKSFARPSCWKRSSACSAAGEPESRAESNAGERPADRQRAHRRPALARRPIQHADCRTRAQ